MDRDPRDRPRRTSSRSRSPASSTPNSRRPSLPRASSTRRTRRATRSARSAATSARTPAACAASSTARPAIPCSVSRSSWPTGGSSGPAAGTSRMSPATAHPAVRRLQGTLGIVTEATLRLRPAPPPRQTLLAFFATLEAAGEAVGRDDADGASSRSRSSSWTGSRSVAVDDWHHLGLDRDGRRDAHDRIGPARSGRRSTSSTVAEAGPASRPARRRWSGRPTPQEADWLRQASTAAPSAHSSGWASPGWRTSGCRARRSRRCSGRSKRIAERHQRPHRATFGHAGDGNLHPTSSSTVTILMRRVDQRGGRDADLYRAALELGGTVTAEHGIGPARRD